jgi:hypothetical protein
MIRAELITQNFNFEAYGQTTSHALNALKRGFAVHAEQYSLPADWWRAHEQNIALRYIKLNQAYRDAEPLIKRKGIE